jgi:tetratricopeptide (TPR) repeat protein
LTGIKKESGETHYKLFKVAAHKHIRMKIITSKLFSLSAILIIVMILQAGAQTRQLHKADSLFLAQDWKNAQQLYTSLLKDTSQNALAWNRLGFSNYHLGKYDTALQNYQRSLALKSSPGLKAAIYPRIAKINGIQNKPNQAMVNIDSAINYGYANYAELDTIKELHTVRNTGRFKKLRERAYMVANPCMAQPHAREFDFWIGEWNVYITHTKTVVGHSVIQVVSGGCSILENWTSAASSGKSLNFVDPANNKWRQTWVGSYANGIQDFVNGEYTNGAMRFTFATTNAQGHKLIGRFIFFNEGPNQVRQFNETSADDGKTWTTGYDYTYMRVKA